MSKKKLALRAARPSLTIFFLLTGFPTMIIDGRVLAKEVLARTEARASRLARAPRVLAIVTSETLATKSYLRIKERRAADAGCVLEVMRFPEDTSTEELVAAVRAATAEAVIVQLPLAAGIDTKQVRDAIPLTKDADVLSSAAREKFERGDADALLPPVVAAVREIFEKNAVDVKGKRAVVLGAGFLVGTPIAAWLAEQGAEVQTLTIETGRDEVAAALRAAAIIVSGVGSPHLITPDMPSPGVVLIDAGTSELGGEVVGDADPACAGVASLFTPVPGGVGPLAVACLFENVVSLAGRGQPEETTHS